MVKATTDGRPISNNKPMTTTAEKSDAAEDFRKAHDLYYSARRDAYAPAREANAEVARLQSAISTAKSEAEAIKLSDELEKAERLAKIRNMRQGDSGATVMEALAAAYRSVRPALDALEAKINDAMGDHFDVFCETLRETISPALRGDLRMNGMIEGAIDTIAGKSFANYPACILQGEIQRFRQDGLHAGFGGALHEGTMEKCLPEAKMLIDRIEAALPSIAADSDRIRRAAAAFAAEIEN